AIYVKDLLVCDDRLCCRKVRGSRWGCRVEDRVDRDFLVILVGGWDCTGKEVASDRASPIVRGLQGVQDSDFVRLLGQGVERGDVRKLAAGGLLPCGEI